MPKTAAQRYSRTEDPDQTYGPGEHPLDKDTAFKKHVDDYGEIFAKHLKKETSGDVEPGTDAWKGAVNRALDKSHKEMRDRANEMWSEKPAEGTSPGSR